MTKDYYGVKRVTAWEQIGPPMSARKQDAVGANEEDDDRRPGYAVRYAAGYESWSPKEAFEAAYKPVDAMGFEGALAAMKAGHKVARANPLHAAALLFMKDGAIWEASSSRFFKAGYLNTTDLLAEDWTIVE